MHHLGDSILGLWHGVRRLTARVLQIHIAFVEVMMLEHI